MPSKTERKIYNAMNHPQYYRNNCASFFVQPFKGSAVKRERGGYEKEDIQNVRKSSYKYAAYQRQMSQEYNKTQLSTGGKPMDKMNEMD
jgi:hypothetical protein